MSIRDRVPNREQVVMLLLQAVARYWGIHPALLPARHYKVFTRAGIDPSHLRATLKRIHSMDEWPHVWAEEAKAYRAQGKDLAEFLCLYMAQRVIIKPSDLKTDLYGQAAAVYRTLDHTWPLDVRTVKVHDEQVSVIIQEPSRAVQGTILLVPGVTFTKEELHFASHTFLARGYRVARMDNPVYGETTGTIQSLGTHYIAAVAKLLRAEYGEPLYGIGFSLGGFLLLKNAQCVDRVVTIGAPCDPDRYLDKMPAHSQEALQHMIGAHDLADLRQMMHDNRLTANDVGSTPLLIVHGGKDRTVPPDEMTRIASRARGVAFHLTYPHESHGCMNSLEEIWAECLEWFAVAASDRRPLHMLENESGLSRAVDLVGGLADKARTARDHRISQAVSALSERPDSRSARLLLPRIERFGRCGDPVSQ